VVDSTWIHAAVGVIFVVGGAESPMGWGGILAVLGLTTLVARITLFSNLTVAIARTSGLLLGAAIVYLVIGGQVGGEAVGLDLAWPWRAVRADQADGEMYVFRAFWGGIVALVLWWRGLHLATTRNWPDTLVGSFKTGLVVLGIAGIFEVVFSIELDVFPMMFLFMTAGLTGLGFAHLLPGTTRSLRLGVWYKIVTPIIGVVVIAGLALGLLTAAVFPFVFRVLSLPFVFVVEQIIRPVLLLLAYIAGRLWAWVFGLWNAPPGEQSFGGGGGSGMVESVPGASGQGDPPAFLGVLAWLIVAAVVAFVVYRSAAAVRKATSDRWPNDGGERESVSEGTDPALDALKLLYGLLPSRFRRSLDRTIALPDGEPGIVEALRIYYDILTLAEAKGVARSPSETPTEFQSKLEQIFAPKLVQMATTAFVRACYGYRASPEAHLSEIRLQIGPKT
jgi:hypothetical protein